MDDVIAEMDANMMSFTKLSNKWPSEYAEALWKKALRCNRVFDEDVLKGISIRIRSRRLNNLARAHRPLGPPTTMQIWHQQQH